MEEWKTDILENLLDALIDYRGKTPQKVNQGIPLITAKIVKGGRIDTPEEFLANDDYDSWMRRGYPQIGDVVLTTEAPLGEVAQISYLPVALAQRIVTLRGKEGILDSTYLKYFLQSEIGQKRLSARETGTTVTGIKQSELRKVEITYPSFPKQRKIASILKSIDDKIELNNRINHNLEEQMGLLFNELCIGKENCSDASLTEIADYINGLAMQKFPAQDGEKGYPVLKIKELGQGFCDESSDRCTHELKPDSIIHDGDIVFSWSGTLLVDMWCGGTCGLNQHLFKVQSKKFPKWFYYMWTKHHLENFIHIAKDKAVTMGHIKRGHLESAIVQIPSADVMDSLDKLFSPMLEQIQKIRLENRKLQEKRNLLLPRLMSGEITC